MKRNTSPGETPKAKLDQAHDKLLMSLESIIDVEAGLREILLQSDNEAMTQSLSAVIDVETGLREILPATHDELRPVSESIASQSTSGIEQIKQAIYPAARMMLRADPYFIKLITAQRHMEVAEETCRRTREIARDLQHALFGGQRMKLAVAGDYAVVLTSAAEDILITLREVAEIAPMLFGETYEQVEEMVRFGRELKLAIDRANVITREYQRARRWDTNSGRQAARELARDISRAQKEIEYRADGLERIVPTYAMMLADLKYRHYVQIEARNLLHAPEIPVFKFSEWRELLDDFTSADLRGALLVGVDLTGVRWTLRHTFWPQEIDVEDLRMRSMETPEGSGVFVVRSGTARIREFVS
ncbi:hypothetical protein [Streptomyces sp. NPDC006309]|uniref:hypothetical protein n=1 Tax=Streptomyces sp. NPDC006309 TaxID=3156749 RepID=UPI0033ABB63F